MSKNTLNVIINEPGWEQEISDISSLSSQVMETVVSYVKDNEEIDFLSSDKPLIVNLSLSNDTEIHTLNRDFRQMDKPTNVLSFANIDDPEFTSEINYSDEIELGDIIIALETMQREAAEKNISLQNHFCHLLTHGLLHLLGFDHQEDDEAEYMEDFEVKILQQLNIANPYTE